MKKLLLILLSLIVIAAVAFFAFRSSGEIHVLVFSKTQAFRHESIAAGKAAILKMGREKGFSVDTTENADIFKEKNLKKYNVIIFLNTTGDILNEAQQIELNRFLQAGGGWVGVHAAADTEYDWPWYGGLVGAWFKNHPNNPNVREARVEVKDKDHPASESLPNEWTHTDEWYNYQSFGADLTVLVNLDESSYEGGENGENHPITWYHEYDGGRAFYTGLGHTDETYEDENFLKILWGGIKYAGGEGQPVNYNLSTVAPEESRFRKLVLAQNLNEPMELVMLPDRKILFVERRGGIKEYDPKTEELRTVMDFEVHFGHEDGLLGIVLDPDYAQNNQLYLFYSPVGDEPKQHVSRFVYKDGKLDLESEQVLLEIPTQREQCCHSAGSLEFGPDGNLFISVGDNTSPRASDGYSPSDEREGRGPWDAQKSSSNMNDLRGKILRIKPTADGYEIPDGNLFPKDGSEGRPEIYVMGCRNPFRIGIDAHTGYLYWGEVGPDAGEDSTGRGPMGYDEVNQAKGPGFFGWPYFVADNKAYHEYDFATETSLQAYNPEKPINNSPNNTGKQELPPAQKAFIYYPYGASKEFPLTGDGGRNAMAGPVYYFQDFPDNPNRYPEYYNGKLFAYDWMRGWIMAVTMDENGNLVRMERFLPNTKFNNPVDMIFGPDGDIWMLEYGTNWFTANSDARLVHLEYVSGNRQPVARIAADQSIGSVPVTVNFTGDESVDYDGDDLTYAWSFDSEEVQSTDPNPSYTFSKPGTYDVKLIVTDPAGEANETSFQVMVGNALPDITWKIEGNRSFFFPNQSLNYEVVVNDVEDGKVSQTNPGDVTVSFDFLEKGHDINEVSLGHEAMMETSKVLLGKQLIENYNCKACHQLDQKSVGPTYREVAKKYTGDQKTISQLAQKVIKGGSGVWGEVVMAAHPHVSASEAEQMIKYILSLEGEVQTASQPIKGTFTPANNKVNEESVYVLMASYTDKGGTEIGPLTGRETILLRHPKIEAESASEINKVMKFEVTPEMTQGMVDEPLEIIFGRNGGYARYEPFDFTGIKSFEFAAIAPSMFMEGGILEFRIDAPDGKLIGQYEVESTLNVSLEAAPSRMDIETVEGMHAMYLVFRTKEGADGMVCSVDFLIARNVPAQGL